MFSDDMHLLCAFENESERTTERKLVAKLIWHNFKEIIVPGSLPAHIVYSAFCAFKFTSLLYLSVLFLSFAVYFSSPSLSSELVFLLASTL